MKLAYGLFAATALAGTTAARSASLKYFYDATCNTDIRTGAEIVAATADENLLVYTDSNQDTIGFIDISDASHPEGKGYLEMPGTPSSVAIKSNYALVSVDQGGVVAAVNSNARFKTIAGVLAVVDISSTPPAIVRTINLGGRPDAIALSPDKKFAVVAIENERDEDSETEGEGIPQSPPGWVAVLDISDNDPSNWGQVQAVDVALDNSSGLVSPEDPEPEYVSVNQDNVAVVTLQENNGAVFIDLEDLSAQVTGFSLGTVSLEDIDREDDKKILQVETEADIPREPDGVIWMDNERFITINEGDLNGGSRGWSIFHKDGSVIWDAGNSMELLVASIGHYPDKRSDNKGNEPENGAFSADLGLAFIASERSSVIAVYDVKNKNKDPVFHQVLPTGVAPEGIIYLPNKEMLVVACELDARDDKIRSSVVLYEYGADDPSYPTIKSQDVSGVPIPFGALSGLSAPATGSLKKLYSLDDSFYKSNRIFEIDVSSKPAVITNAVTIKDSDGVFASFLGGNTEIDLGGTCAQCDNKFTAEDLAAMINADMTVNIDGEGIAAVDGGFWIASEGSGTVDEENRAIKTLNFLFKVDTDGVIEEVVALPQEVNQKQLRFGFEGIAVDGEYVLVAFQRAWAGEAHPRIGIYDTDAETWKFVLYPADPPASQNGGWVGLSDITSLGGGEFLVLERDNQGGPDAAIKRIYKISLDLDNDGVSSGSGTPPTISSKTLIRDVKDDVSDAIGGLALEKIEGMAFLNGEVWINNDNDGVDDNSGENQLINVGDVL